VLPETLVFTLSDEDLIPFKDQHIVMFEPADQRIEGVLESDIAGWSSYSGILINDRKQERIREQVRKALSDLNFNDGVLLNTTLTSPVSEQRNILIPSTEGQFSAVLFGFGNYAKTQILPHLNHNIIIIRKIHEIDPTQLSLPEPLKFSVDTSPVPRTSENYDVYFIAGYHHTHTPITVYALKHGKYAVVEKPLSTSFAQMGNLLDALRQTDGGLFTGFHKRYSSLNEFVFKDLNVAPGEPISYYCIIHEVKLPRRHWYNWPNSGSRLVSNGCHWLDHFLFLNKFVEVSKHNVSVAQNGTMVVSVELMNGAFFNMVLTDEGSSRIGVAEHIELRAKDRTVTITNNSRYFAESSERILRKVAVNKISSYHRMYTEISNRIVAREPGDSPESVERSTHLMLAIEEEVQALLKTKQVG